MDENGMRASRAYRHALIFYCHEQYDDENTETGIVDLMADLLHLADQYGLEATEAQRLAWMHYTAERVEA